MSTLVAAGSRLRALWDSVRPRTRRGGFLAALAILGGAAVLSVALLAGAAMAWNPYVEFSLDRRVDAERWATLDLAFATAGACGECHAPQAAKADTASHAGIGCQSCHGALAEHVLLGDEADAATISVVAPTDAVCVACHVQVEGRPASVRQIVPDAHYTDQCLACHDPHSGVSNPPPVVEHPLVKLPRCMTCHGPDGFKARNIRHPVVDTGDWECMSCHLNGRGPRPDGGSR